ncbi:MAG: PIN domain-containing protein [Acidobacteria bacterium]|nr:PIN domain-containing protein [Acidobacteriota bacterium]
MIYLDTSVALAELYAEDRYPAAELWDASLTASRLIEYEIWNSVHRHGRMASHGDAARAILDRIAMAEMSREVLRRAVEPFPTEVRTLDALHLATIGFLRDQGVEVRLATYDRRMAAAARLLAIPLAEL